MLIKDTKIEGFGKLVDKSFAFKPGINIVFGKNESGKTTLAKFLLYTLSTPSEGSQKYKPWYSEKFGGVINTSNGDYTFSKVSEINYPKSILETISFIFEDDSIDISLEKGFVKSSLKKRSEKTSFGITVTTALERLKQADVNSCILKYSEKMKEIEARINEIRKEIEIHNDNVLEVRKLKKELKNLEKEFTVTYQNYNELKENYFNQLKNELKNLSNEKNSLESELQRYEWLNKISEDEISEIQKLFIEEENLTRKIEELKNTISTVRETLDEKSRKISERLDSFGITSEKDLENVHLRLKHLSLLSKMYVENQQKVVSEDPLWRIFLDNKNIVDQYEEETQKMKQGQELKEQEIKELESKIDKYLSLSKLFKDLTILSFLISIGIFVAAFLVSPVNIILYGSATLFSVLGIISALRWRKNGITAENLEGKLTEVSMRKVGDYPLIKTLKDYNINGVKDLRKRYEEFIEWKAQNREQQKIYEENKELEAEIIRELSRFNITGATQMIVSAVERLQKQFDELQELVYERDSVERKLAELRMDLGNYQKKYSEVVEQISSLLKKLGISKEDVNEYTEGVKESSKLKEKLANIENQIERIKNSLDSSLLPNEILNVKSEVDILKSKIDETKSKIDNLESKISNYVGKEDELKKLLNQYDEIYLKMSISRKLVDSIESVRKKLEDALKNYAENYLKKFSEELNNTISRISTELKNFVVLDDLSVQLAVSGELLPPNEYLSNSTKDLLVFAFKRAFYKALYSDNLPLIIDNSLVRFDDIRLEKVCEIIKEDSIERQIIILTSDTRLLSKFEDSHILYIE